MMHRHTLNGVEIDEPTGFNQIQIGPVRDEVNHGIGFEATQSSLQFTGNGYQILYQENETNGLRANVIYMAETRCDETQEWTEVFSGRVNFGQIKKVCGLTCTISAPIETKSCEVVLNSRYDQQVDMDKYTGVDNTTALVKYDELGKEITLKAVKYLAIDEANNTSQNTEVLSDQLTWATSNTGNQLTAHIAPRLDNIAIASLGEFNPRAFSELTPGFSNRPGETFGYTIDTTTLLGGLTCEFDGISFSFRLKGSHTIDANLEGISLTIKIFKLPAGSDYPTGGGSGDWVQVYSQPLSSVSTAGGGTGPTNSFDFSGTASSTLIQGDRFTFSLFAISGNRFSEINSYSLTLEKETFFHAESGSLCEDSTVEYYMIHEALSHTVEEITNGCLRVKSSYYGRTNSQPYAFSSTGCGGLRIVTSGLKIRKADNPTFFTSVKNLVDNLRKIDNIGFDVLGNDVRIESVDFFYKNTEILKCPAAVSVSVIVNESGHYAKITAGYKNWQTQKINGLNEFNSEREYKTSLEVISTTLDIQSEFVTGSLPIEVTRQQLFAATGAADTTYDNNTFLICVLPAADVYHTYEVEQGGITNPVNMYSPETAYNWRLRPVANMMRWYKSIASSYRTIMSTLNKVFFSSGTGNILAGGITTDDTCRPEKQPTVENQDIFFSQISDFTPLWINETITFTYPLSLAEYNKIKSNPYGYISVQCGNGDWLKGFIRQLNYAPVKGEGQFTLIRKYGV